jgi:glycerol-3-phosphate acyltransferase PlsY
MNYLIFALIFYLYGSIPFAYLSARLIAKKDLRREGSCNVGVTNAFKTGGIVTGIVTVSCEISKAFFPLIIGKYFFYGSLPATLLFVFCSFLGAMFSVYLKGKGGKGSTVMIWSILVLSPFSLITITLIWFTVYKLSKYYPSIKRIWLFCVPVVLYLIEQDIAFALFGLLYSVCWYLKSLKSIDDLAYFSIFQKQS